MTLEAVVWAVLTFLGVAACLGVWTLVALHKASQIEPEMEARKDSVEALERLWEAS